MGMSTHVVALRPPDQKWQQMKAIWDACQAAKIHPPAEVSDYFDGDVPDPAGVVIDLERHPSVREWGDEYRSGYEVQLDQLPPAVKILRFYNSW